MTATLPLETVADIPPAPQPLWHGFVAPIAFAGLTLAMFSTVLFSSDLVLSSQSTDLQMQFLAWRDFGFTQLRQGHLPLWNPYVYGGTPFFAGFQSALLYPPNWLHLILPLTVAINWIITLHVFLAGYFMYLWCRGRGQGIAGAILAGIMFMFSGAYFLHIYAGHLPHICLMVWVPLVLLAIEKLADTGRFKWGLLGVAAMCMVILAGHPQYVYYTGLITLLYVGLLMISAKHRMALGSGYVIIVAGASLIVAVQLLTGAQAVGESVRSGGTDYDFASMFSLPPENFLTFLAPDFFGKLPMTGDAPDAIQYFGRCYLWEMSVFVSVAGFALAIYGAMAGWKRHLWLLILVGVTAVLALGRHLPVYYPLFKWLPVYGSFRCVAKFSFLLTLFVCALAASGFDDLLSTRRRNWPLFTIIGLTGGAALVMMIVGLIVGHSGETGSDGLWASVLRAIESSHESYLPAAFFTDPRMIKATSAAASSSAMWAAAALAGTCVILVAAKFRREAAYALIGLATLELYLVAFNTRATMTPVDNFPQPWLQAIRSEQGDFRVLNGALPNQAESAVLNSGMSLGFQNLWGYDPGVLKRYAETIAASQGIDPNKADQYLEFRRIADNMLGMLQMLRCRLVLTADKDGHPVAARIPAPLPVAQLVNNWTLRPTRDAALSRIFNGKFDPRRIVVLETPPAILPTSKAETGPAEVVAQSTDWVEVRAQTNAPCLLLITNNYSTGWRVRSLDKSPPQDDYEIEPANYTQMAIPLAAGMHHLRIEYLPTAFRVGKWISIVSLLGYLGCLAVWLVASRRLG